MHIECEPWCRRLRGIHLRRPGRRIPQQPDATNCRCGFFQQFQPLCGQAWNIKKQAGQVAPGPRRFLTLDNRYLPPLLITSILLGAQLSFGILEGWERTALAIVTAIGAELVMGRITYGAWPHPASAYISGISAGILVRSPFLWPYFLTSLISITSKYVLRLKGRHLWNPTNFGVSAVVFLASPAARYIVGQTLIVDGGTVVKELFAS